jgi:ADP-heptose:LPS heptosyltransferase
LQKGQPPLGFGAIELDAMLDDFATTAAVLPNLDLIIAVDTSIVHLAGAMGIPIWLMCPHTPDWRWILNSETSPWYPSLRIFWQHEPGNWSRVISEVNHALSDATLAIEN